MQPLALRLPGAIVALVAVCATLCPATSTAEAIPAPSEPAAATGAEIRLAATTTGKTSQTKKRRRRRSPPGGVYSRYAFVMDPATGEVLYEKNANTSVPIASITKLMTALVFVEQQPDLEERIEVARADLRGAGKTQLVRREKVKLGDILHMSLMCSDNAAARILARSSSLSEEDFLARMNHKALELGLTHTRFVEFTGLDERNVSTAADVARLVKAACSHPRIHSICTKKSYDFSTRRRAHYIPNTNRMLYSRYEVKGGKTGFIRAAGYCFATWIRASERDLIAVVLNAPTAATRFADVKRLVRRTTANLNTARN